MLLVVEHDMEVVRADRITSSTIGEVFPPAGRGSRGDERSEIYFGGGARRDA